MSDMQVQSENQVPRTVAPEIKAAPQIAAATSEQGEIVSSEALVLRESHKAFVDFHQNYVSGYISFADTKAAWVFTIASASLIYLIGRDNFRALIFAPELSVQYVLLGSTVLCLVLSAVYSSLAIWPRLNPTAEGIVFFAAVAKKSSAKSYVREIASMSDSALTEARLKHSYDISSVCTRKYTHLRSAFRVGMLGLLGMGVLLLFW